MYKLVALLFLASVVVAKPGLLAPLITDVLSEKVIESHGNSVVHASAPVVQTYAAAVAPVAVAPVVHSAPLLHSAPLAYSYGHGYGLSYNQPLAYF